MTEDPRLTEAMQAAVDVPAIHAACRDIARSLGFAHFIYGLRVPVSLTQPYHFCLSGYPRAWRERYDAMGYLKVDPLVAHAFASALPVFWDEVTFDGELARRMFEEAASHGLRHGISAPVYGRRGDIAMLSLAGADAVPADAELRNRLKTRVHWFATLLHETVRRVLLTREGAPAIRDNLSEREKDCLMWVADGRTSAEIASLLKISERTVLFHIENAGSKLGVSGRHNVVARAIALGEIELSKHALRRVELPATHEGRPGDASNRASARSH